jgi:hypothetical protein
MGRLGNQMFQFASTLGIAHKLGLDARFPIENCFRLQGSGPFDPKLGRNMLVKCDLLDCFEIDPIYFIPEHHISFENVYNESIFGYNSESESIKDGTVLYGYFQTEKYFLDIREHILSQFKFKEEFEKPASAYMGLIKGEGEQQIVSIHIRRGDYVMFPDHHPTCSKEYYQKSIEKIREHVPQCKFLVFSDDVDWCRNEFNGEEFIICDLNSPYVELCLMSLCDHHIIANSSFSWWGSWLNRSNSKKTIAPSKWFGPAINKDVSDVYFSNTIII